MLNNTAPRKKHASTYHHDQSSNYDQSSMNPPEQYHPEEKEQQLRRKPAAGRRPSRDDIPPDVLQDARTSHQRSPTTAAFDGITSWTAAPRNSRPPRGQYDDQSRYSDQMHPDSTGSVGATSKVGKLSKLGGRNKQSEDVPSRRGDEGESKWSFRAGFKNFMQAGTYDNYEDEYAHSDEYDTRSETQLLEHIHQLQLRYDQQARQISELQANIRTEVEKGKKIKESADKMTYAMESKELFVGRQDSDDAIYSRFQSLIGQIKTWSVHFAQDRSIAQDYSQTSIDELCKVAPCVSDIQRFFQTPKNLRLFVRGYVGLAMAESLFRTLPYGPNPGLYGEDAWMDRELAHSMASIENSLLYADRKVVSERDFHDWRALTATLISKLDTSSKTGKGMEACVTGCVRRIMSLVGNWVAAEELRPLEDELEGILFQAVRLSQTLRCQRACWSVRHLGSGAHTSSNSGHANNPVFFDRGSMNDKYGDEDSDGEDIQTPYRKIVEIVVSPGLFKRGNTDGERFDVESCVEPAEVKCKKPSIGAGHSGPTKGPR